MRGRRSHGCGADLLEPLPNGGVIDIAADQDGTRLRITITNPVADATNRQHAGSRLAQENVAQRLDAHFGKHGRLDIDATDDTYRVTVIVPIQGE